MSLYSICSNVEEITHPRKICNAVCSLLGLGLGIGLYFKDAIPGWAALLIVLLPVLSCDATYFISTRINDNHVADLPENDQEFDPNQPIHNHPIAPIIHENNEHFLERLEKLNFDFSDEKINKISKKMHFRPNTIRSFEDPILLSNCINDPITLPTTGMTYDRKSLAQWIQTGHNSCPKTNLEIPLSDLTVASNVDKKSEIREFVVSLEDLVKRYPDLFTHLQTVELSRSDDAQQHELAEIKLEDPAPAVAQPASSIWPNVWCYFQTPSVLLAEAKQENSLEDESVSVSSPETTQENLEDEYGYRVGGFN